MSGGSHLVGVDVGGTTTDAVVVSPGGRRLARVVLPTSAAGGAAVVTSTVKAIDAATDEAGIGTANLGAIGIGIPGQVEPETGVVRTANNLAIDASGYPIGGAVAAHFDTPTTIENDVRAAAIGLYTKAVEAPQILTYLSIGTGISAGTVVDGRLLRGSHGVAGELGQMPVVTGGSGGLLTSSERAAAGPAVVSLATEHDIERDEIFMTPAGSVILHVLADVVTTIFVAYDPDVLYVGGGVTRTPGFHSALLGAVRTLCDHPNLTNEFVDLSRISAVPPGSHPGTAGAIYLARQAMEEPGRQVRPAKLEATT